MALQALLLSHDLEVQETISAALNTAGIDLEICITPEQATQCLKQQKYDALMIDCDDTPNAKSVLQQLRLGKSNRTTITFLFINGRTTVEQAFEMKANFVLDKPISIERALRSIRAAQGLIIRERRRYHRFLVNATGAILVDTGSQLPVSITNISEGGISIECNRRLDEGGAARLKFILPGAKKPIEIKGEVIWSTPDGRAGVRFQVLQPESKVELEKWLGKRALPLQNGAVFIDATLQV